MADAVLLGEFDDGKVSFELAYDDNLDVVTMRGRNKTDVGALCVVYRLTNGVRDGVQYAMEVLPKDTQVLIIPQNAQHGIRLVPGGRPGSWENIECEMRYPF